MMEAIYFKILQRQLKFRNPNHLLRLPVDFKFTAAEFQSAKKYLQTLFELNIQWTFPGHEFYPPNFLRMKEPPLFLEFKGKPFWISKKCISVVGARKIHTLSEKWINTELAAFLSDQQACLVSGGAYGVDQQSHAACLKISQCTIVVVPSGLVDVYPKNLPQLFKYFDPDLVCFVSEFEIHQTLHKSHFFYRNRLIAAFGEVTLIIQAEIKSGSLLTVHHALEFGRPVLTLPAHPQMLGFSGNLKLLQDGAVLICSSLDLLEIWNSEIMMTPQFVTLA